jgi:transposase
VKVHASVSSEGLPLSLVLSPGNEHDSRRFVEVLAEIRIGKGIGRPISRPFEVLADAAYDNNEIRLYLRRRGIKSNIPCNKRNLKTSRRGRPTRFDQQSYRKRGSIERFFGWLKSGFRRLATRYERLNTCFMGLIYLACFLIYWKRVSSEVLK